MQNAVNAANQLVVENYTTASVFTSVHISKYTRSMFPRLYAGNGTKVCTHGHQTLPLIFCAKGVARDTRETAPGHSQNVVR